MNELISKTKQYFNEVFRLKEYELVCYTYNGGVTAEIHCKCEPLISSKSMKFFSDNYGFFHCKKIKPLFRKEIIVLIFFENSDCIRI